MTLDRNDRADIKGAGVIFAGDDEVEPAPVLIYGEKLWREIMNGSKDGDIPVCHLEWDGTVEQLGELRRVVRELKGKE